MPARKKSIDPKGRSKAYSGKDLGQFKKCELVAFLKARGVPATCNLKQLLALAKVKAHKPALGADSSSARWGFVHLIGHRVLATGGIFKK